MQIGERFSIGNTLWKVVKRRFDRYDPDGDRSQIITLRCVDSDESRQRKVGIVSHSLVIKPSRDFITDGIFDKNDEANKESGVGAAFYPLMRVATGFVRNNRPAVVTEVGLRSKVFQRLNGLCTFNTVPSPGELDDFDNEEVTVRSGTYTGAIKRSSVFQVFVRQAGLDPDGKKFAFERINIYFAVTGSTPVDQYNFIRFTHPQGLPPTELEFKFLGIPASELRTVSDSEEIIRLSASVSDDNQALLRLNAPVPGLGTFVVAVAGARTTKSQIRLNKEFIRKPVEQIFESALDKPREVERNITLPQDQAGDVVTADAIEKQAQISNSTSILSGKNGAFFHTIFGSCDNDPINEGGEKVLQTREKLSSTRWMAVKWTVRKTRLPDTHYARVNNNVTFTWALLVVML